MEIKDKLLPCQQALVASREEIRGLGVYRCPEAVFVLSGADTGSWNWPVRSAKKAPS